ncbi:MAG: VWA domain-containing protein [Candidatus Lokiarchaeota archaeon]|nr:VWA domain-containing protein [Candidatus Lokiarchaeota archaeon]
MTEQRIPENIVICLDTSRSMYRKDFSPYRLRSCTDAMKTLIAKRFELDSLSTFALIKFSNRAETLLGFTSSTYINNLNNALDSLTCGGYSALGDGLALAIKTVIAELRKIGAKPPRILLISDGKIMKTAVDPLKMARLAQGLNIKIDTFLVGQIGQVNTLKKLSDVTKGRYFYNSDPESLIRSANEIADDNYKRYGSNQEVISENPAFLRKIAADLLRVQDLTSGQEQRAKQIRGEVDYKKCSICFSDKNPYTKGSFYVTGRYCPNCTTPFHIHCLAGWADSQKDHKIKRSGTARCPHCFYLLRIPTEVTQIQKLRVLSRGTKEEPTQRPEILPAKFIEDVALLGEDAMFNACPVCHLIFEKGQRAVQCGNLECNTLYHEECFKKLKEGQCRTCDVKLHLY